MQRNLLICIVCIIYGICNVDDPMGIINVNEFEEIIVIVIYSNNVTY